jgi:hypothetical protein
MHGIRTVGWPDLTCCEWDAVDVLDWVRVSREDACHRALKRLDGRYAVSSSDLECLDRVPLPEGEVDHAYLVGPHAVVRDANLRLRM